jgi:hypothetical protein
MAVKRQRWTNGAIVTIPLGNGIVSYAQMLNEPEYVFFDCKTSHEIPLESVIKKAVLFRLWVMRSAHSTGRWLKVGNAPIKGSLNKEIPRFKQDPLHLENICIYINGQEGAQCTLAECENLECAAIWNAEHVEDRLRSYYNRVPCNWSLSLRPKVAS